MAEIALLKEKQARFADYDEIKRELDIIKVCDTVLITIVTKSV